MGAFTDLPPIMGPAGPPGATGSTGAMGATGPVGPTGADGPTTEAQLRDVADELTATLNCGTQAVRAAAFITAAAAPPTAGLLRSANPETHVMTTNGAGADVSVLRSFGSTSHVIGDPTKTVNIYYENAPGGENLFRTNGATVATLGSGGLQFAIAAGQPVTGVSFVRFASGSVGTIQSPDAAAKITVTNAGIGVFGHAPAAQQADFGAFADNSGGADGDSVEDVGLLFSQATINDNFASVAAKINEIRAVLRAHGWMA